MPWLATPEGRLATTRVEHARIQLLAAIEDRDALKVTLEEAKQNYNHLGLQAAAIDNGIRSSVVPSYQQLQAKHKLLAAQAITYNDDAAKKQLEVEKAHEDALRSRFQDLWLRATAAQVTELPVELQKMTCEAVMGSDVSRSVGWGYSAEPGGFEFETRSMDTCSLPGFFLYKDCFNRSVVGLAFAQEMAKAWYRHRLVIDLGHGDLRAFLLYDRWGLGLRPADLITDLNICLDKHSSLLDTNAQCNIYQFLPCFLLLNKGRRICFLFEYGQVVDNMCLHCDRSRCEHRKEGLFGRHAAEYTYFFLKLRYLCKSLGVLRDGKLLVTVELKEDLGQNSGQNIITLYKPEQQGPIDEIAITILEQHRHEAEEEARKYHVRKGH